MTPGQKRGLQKPVPQPALPARAFQILSLLLQFTAFYSVTREWFEKVFGKKKKVRWQGFHWLCYQSLFISLVGNALCSLRGLQRACASVGGTSRSFYLRQWPGVRNGGSASTGVPAAWEVWGAWRQLCEHKEASFLSAPGLGFWL